MSYDIIIQLGTCCEQTRYIPLGARGETLDESEACRVTDVLFWLSKIPVLVSAAPLISSLRIRHILSVRVRMTRTISVLL